MIARIWRAAALPENAAAYIAHFQRDLLPELRQLNGFHDAFMLRRDQAEVVEITVITVWASLDAIRAFAGENLDVAVVAPAAQAVLQSFDSTVVHTEVVLKTW